MSEDIEEDFWAPRICFDGVVGSDGLSRRDSLSMTETSCCSVLLFRSIDSKARSASYVSSARRCFLRASSSASAWRSSTCRVSSCIRFCKSRSSRVGKSLTGVTGFFTDTGSADPLGYGIGTIVVVLRKCTYFGLDAGGDYRGQEPQASTPTPETPRSAMRRLV